MRESYVEIIDDKVFQGQDIILEIYLANNMNQKQILAERWMFNFNNKINRLKTNEQCINNHQVLQKSLNILLNALPFLQSIQKAKCKTLDLFKNSETECDWQIKFQILDNEDYMLNWSSNDFLSRSQFPRLDYNEDIEIQQLNHVQQNLLSFKVIYELNLFDIIQNENQELIKQSSLKTDNDTIKQQVNIQQSDKNIIFQQNFKDLNNQLSEQQNLSDKKTHSTNNVKNQNSDQSVQQSDSQNASPNKNGIGSYKSISSQKTVEWSIIEQKNEGSKQKVIQKNEDQDRRWSYDTYLNDPNKFIKVNTKQMFTETQISEEKNKQKDRNGSENQEGAFIYKNKKANIIVNSSSFKGLVEIFSAFDPGESEKVVEKLKRIGELKKKSEEHEVAQKQIVDSVKRQANRTYVLIQEYINNQKKVRRFSEEVM